MRHRKSGRILNRTSAHRVAMFRNMAASLFRHEQIQTTLAKAKELRRVAEPLITLGKTASVANRRLAFARLRDREVVAKLFSDLGPRFRARPGGYLRILKNGFRAGDRAPMAVVQLVERQAEEAAAASDKTAASAKKTKKKTGSTAPAKKKPAEKKAGSAKAAEPAPTKKKKVGKKK